MHAHLLTDVFHEVLLRFTDEELLVLKRVCKSWNSLISDPTFVHLRLSRYKPHIFFSTDTDCYSINMQYKDIPLKKIILPGKNFSVESFCDGLILLLETYELSVYNPFTKRKNRLPPQQLGCCNNWELVRDALTGKYKIFGITSTGQNYVMAFTQGGKSSSDWRSIRKKPKQYESSCYPSQNRVCMDNKVYWSETMDLYSDDRKSWIYSIDVTKEKVEEYEVSCINSPTSYLSEMNGSLCITNVLKDGMNTWISKDMANNKWIKCHSIKYEKMRREIRETDPSSEDGLLQCKHFVVEKDTSSSTKFGDRLKWFASNYNHLYLYDVKNKELRKIADIDRNNSRWSLKKYGFHVNSLASWE